MRQLDQSAACAGEQGGNMNGKATLKLVPGLLLGMALAGPAFGQSATQSMKNAGNSAESAVSNTWQGTKAAVKDTDITAKVKIALHNSKLTKGRDIHVDTHDGVVRLTGYAPQNAARQAAHLARNTTGVVGVNNDIRSNNSVSSR
jgi:osmotically-inducible protein OsmY